MNHQLHLLFRGQASDYLDTRGRSSLLPTIYRSASPRLTRATLAARFRILAEFEAAVHKNRRALQFHIGVSDHPEYPQALLQHYGICPTPLLDLTQSLRVAATFALKDSVENQGFLYIVAVPHATGSITHHADERIALVRLLNVCPKEALRPHFQEGFLAGRMVAKTRSSIRARFRPTTRRQVPTDRRRRVLVRRVSTATRGRPATDRRSVRCRASEAASQAGGSAQKARQTPEVASSNPRYVVFSTI